MKGLLQATILLMAALAVQALPAQEDPAAADGPSNTGHNLRGVS